MKVIDLTHLITGHKVWINQQIQIVEVYLKRGKGTIKHISADVTLRDHSLSVTISRGTTYQGSLYLREMVTRSIEHGLLKESNLPIKQVLFLEITPGDDIYTPENMKQRQISQQAENQRIAK
jgi:hypothetical protein